MELKGLKLLDQFGHEYMTKVYKANLTNDAAQKIAFLSKLPGNLGDLRMKDLENQRKIIDQIHWIDLLLRCVKKVKYLCWQKKTQDLSPSNAVCRNVLPWTPLKNKKRRNKRYGKYKPRRVANPKKPYPKYRFVKKRRFPKKSN